MFFPRGTVIAPAHAGLRRSGSAWGRPETVPQGLEALRSLCGGRRTAQRCGNTPHLRQSRQRYPHAAVSLGICRPKYRTRREVSGCGVGPASQRLPFPAAKSDASRVGHTVPVRKRCRTRGELLAYRAGSLTVPEGKPYRTGGELLPYRWGTLTVLRGKFLRDFSCKLRKKLRKKRLHLFMLVH